MNRERWLNLMRACGFGDNVETYEALSRAYAERHRHYHTSQHIEFCLSLLDEYAALAEHVSEVELALWFHDAVYQPLSNSNELRSAALAAKFLRSNRAPEAMVDRVSRFVLVTRHAEEPQGRDEALLLDIDLAILGADAVTYAAYEAHIRTEYRMVPWFVYRRKRAQILRGFMERSPLYRNDLLEARFGQVARANLLAAITQLGGQ